MSDFYPNAVEDRVKRRRVTRACDSCKAKKRRCTGDKPCSYCVEHAAQCTYEMPHNRGKHVESHSTSPLRGPSSGRALEDGSMHQHPRQWPEQTLLQNNSDHLESGQQSAPNIQQQPGDGLVSRARSPVALNGQQQYLGPTSPFSFIRRASRRLIASDGLCTTSEDIGTDVPIYQLGDRKIPDINVSLVRLPNTSRCSVLLNRYFDFAAPTYRFLHHPTLRSWLGLFQADEKLLTTQLSPARRAVVFMVLATASLYNVDTSHTILNEEADEEAGEGYFQAAQELLNHETGPVRLESIQARIASSLYLLNTSRLNQAWYIFGTATQLMVALGIHRSSQAAMNLPDHVITECRKRTFWAAYTLDTYFSVMLGRPPYIQEAFADQEYPALVNDKDLTSDRIGERSEKIDCNVTASVLHAKLAGIVRQASTEQCLLHRTTEEQQLRTAARLNEKVTTWRRDLPVLLSGAVQPESLIPMFRRQLTVLRLAFAHAVMLINRPLILSRRLSIDAIGPHVEECLSAVKDVFDVVMDLVANSRIFSAFWYTQYIAFNALSIAYVWIIQHTMGRHANVQSQYHEETTLELAETVQAHLAAATQKNAPNLRYSLILGELQREARRAVQASRSASRDPGTSSSSGGQASGGANTIFAEDLTGTAQWDLDSLEFPLDPNLWLHIDAFPFGN